MSTHSQETAELEQILEGMKLSFSAVKVNIDGRKCKGWSVVLDGPEDLHEILRRARDLSLGVSPNEMTNDVVVIWVRP